jgi:hypothetical protein
MHYPFWILNPSVSNTKRYLNSLTPSIPPFLLFQRKKNSAVQSLRHNVQPTLNVSERRDGGERIIYRDVTNFSV